MAVDNPRYLQARGYSAKADRQFTEMLFDGEGALGPGDLRATASGLGVSVATGEAAVRGDTNPDQGLYAFRNDAAAALAVTADPTNPKPYIIIARVYDNTEAGGGLDQGALEAIAGTAVAGATLDNRTNMPALPASAMPLADVVVPAAAGSLAAGDIRDRRPFAAPGIIPPTKTVVDMVQFESSYVPGEHQRGFEAWEGCDLHQAAALMYLPRRIAGATRMRWSYQQGSGTAMTGNYVLGIADASGRLLVNSGSVALVGAVATTNNRAETIAATTFEAGLYYVFVGLDFTNAGTMSFLSTPTRVGALGSTTGAIVPNAPNILLRSTTGGLTVPTTILGLTDVHTLALTSVIPGVPQIALSIG